MKTAADIVTAISRIYYQVNLFEDKQLVGYIDHFAWPEWGGHKQMIDCPQCDGAYCWRCRDEHIDECANSGDSLHNAR